MTGKRKPTKSPEVMLLAAARRSKAIPPPAPQDETPAKTVRLEIDAETFAFFGADSRKMEAALRLYAEEQSIKEAYEITRLNQKRSK